MLREPVTACVQVDSEGRVLLSGKMQYYSLVGCKILERLRGADGHSTEIEPALRFLSKFAY